ncbi:MAG: ABC transporter ATP-binding protein [Candidatus Hodarchaeales archaeon]|jgi:ABC-type branched-subunit amino acid transport system ATPase component
MPEAKADAQLAAKDIHKYFGGLKALEGATVVVSKNKLFSLIGPNGSGKTTFFNVITCWLEKTNPYKYDIEKSQISKLLSWLSEKFGRNEKETSAEPVPEEIGSVTFENLRIDGLTTHEAALTGMLRTFQTTRNWPKLTVLENLLVAPPKQIGDSFLNIFFKRRKIKEEERKNTLRALEILEFLEITHIRDQIGEELSGGQLKILALGRLLMTAPELILLDEPTAGINPSLANKIMDKIVDLKANSTIFLIEHNMDVVFNYSDEIFVMARGKIIAQGTPNEIETNRDVIEAYLGADY